VLPVTLQQPDSSGALSAINLTGLTVSFKMVNAADGVMKIAATSTGVTVVSAAAGTVNYDFSAEGVDEAGVFWGTFLVTESGQTDAVPVRQKDLKIIIDSDTQTGEEAFDEATN
jgi:hypothetical protein